MILTNKTYFLKTNNYLTKLPKSNLTNYKIIKKNFTLKRNILVNFFFFNLLNIMYTNWNVIFQR